MGIVLRKSNTIQWPINLKTPKDAGGYNEHQVTLTFKILKQSELKNILNKSKEAESPDVEFCKAIIYGWQEVKDADDKELKFTEENLKEFLETFGFSASIAEQYIDMLTKAIEKN